MANIDAWIISFPPVYTDLDLTTPAFSYFVYEEPSTAILQKIADDNGTVRHIVVPDTFNNVEPDVTINGSSVSVTDNGSGEYEFDHPEDNAQVITITLDDGDGGTISVPEFTYYNSYQFLLGSDTTLPIYTKTQGGTTVYKLNYSDGTTVWSAANARLAYDQQTNNNTCCVSDDGVAFFIDNDAGLSAGYCKIFRLDTDGNLTTIYTSPAISDTDYRRLICYDRHDDILHAWLANVPHNQYTYLTFNKAGTQLSTTSGVLPADAVCGMAAYNGNLWLARAGAAKKVWCGANSIVLDAQFNDPTQVNAWAIPDGYCYIMIADNQQCPYIYRLSSSSISWSFTYFVSGRDYLAGTSPMNFYVNDDGTSSIYASVAGTIRTHILDSTGTTVDFFMNEHRMWLDNSENYYEDP